MHKGAVLSERLGLVPAHRPFHHLGYADILLSKRQDVVAATHRLTSLHGWFWSNASRQFMTGGKEFVARVVGPEGGVWWWCIAAVTRFLRMSYKSQNMFTHSALRWTPALLSFSDLPISDRAWREDDAFLPWRCRGIGSVINRCVWGGVPLFPLSTLRYLYSDI